MMQNLESRIQQLPIDAAGDAVPPRLLWPKLFNINCLGHLRLVSALVILTIGCLSSTPLFGQASTRIELNDDATVIEASTPQVQEPQDPESAGTKPETLQSRGKASQEEFQEFMRIRRDERRRPVALETSVTRYQGTNANGETVTVDLIGVVHVGEQEYYESLNEEFKKYDATLYELVAPEGTRIPKGGRDPEADAGFNPVAGLQLGLKSMLGLEFQLDHIDYMAENLVHADMTPEEFMESMNQNEESFGRMFLNSIGSSMAMQSKGKSVEADMLLSLFSKDRTKRLRRTMAEQMQDIEGGMAIFQGKEGSTIIDHRNAKVMEILKREMVGGKKNIAIFYGAGHLPDMQRRLMSDFQMKKGGRFWMTAWNLAGKSE